MIHEVDQVKDGSTSIDVRARIALWSCSGGAPQSCNSHRSGIYLRVRSPYGLTHLPHVHPGWSDVVALAHCRVGDLARTWSGQSPPLAQPISFLSQALTSSPLLSLSGLLAEWNVDIVGFFLKHEEHLLMRQALKRWCLQSRGSIPVERHVSFTSFVAYFITYSRWTHQSP